MVSPLVMRSFVIVAGGTLRLVLPPQPEPEPQPDRRCRARSQMPGTPANSSRRSGRRSSVLGRRAEAPRPPPHPPPRLPLALLRWRPLPRVRPCLRPPMRSPTRPTTRPTMRRIRSCGAESQCIGLLARGGITGGARVTTKTSCPGSPACHAARVAQTRKTAIPTRTVATSRSLKMRSSSSAVTTSAIVKTLY